jgi:serine/threonine-protein kinase
MKIGEGGMGEVWRATHAVTNKPVALKFLKGRAARSTTAVKRFIREARAASAIRHPNVVQIHDVLSHDDGYALVMDLLEGESLARYFERRGTVPLGDLANVLLPIMAAVKVAHASGIVHRDLKPDNVFLEQSGDGTVVPKVLDFGVAKLTADHGVTAETAGLTDTGAIVGTPRYMAPEQAFGEDEVDQRTDIWALGIIVYEGLTGRQPIQANNLGQLYKALSAHDLTPLRALRDDLPDSIYQLVDHMLTSAKDDRLTNLDEAIAVLASFASNDGLTLDMTSSAHNDALAPTIPSDAAAAETELLVASDSIALPRDATSSRIGVAAIAAVGLIAGGAWWFGARDVDGARAVPPDASASEPVPNIEMPSSASTTSAQATGEQAAGGEASTSASVPTTNTSAAPPPVIHAPPQPSAAPATPTTPPAPGSAHTAGPGKLHTDLPF